MGIERFIESHDGTKIYTNTSGEGPTLVLCDGLGCEGFIWKHFRERFGATHRIVHWNYRGHGLSHCPEDYERLTTDDLIEDLRQVLEQLDINNAVLCGHSMGVQLILEFAYRYPEKVAGLLPMCGSYGRPLETFHDGPLLGIAFPFLRELVFKSPRRAQWVWSNANKNELAFQFAMISEVNSKAVNGDDFRPYFEHLAGMDIGVFIRVLDSVSRHTVEDHLPLIKAPTLIVAAEHDTFTPAWLSQHMRHQLPDAELLTVEGGTHIAPIEFPELIHRRVEPFLRKCFAATAAKPKKRTRRKKAPATDIAHANPPESQPLAADGTQA